MALPKKYRILGDRNLKKVWQADWNVSNRDFLTKSLNNQKEFSRWSVFVPRTAVPSAVSRHYLKRKIQEALKNLQGQWPKGRDTIIVSKPLVRKKNFKEIIASLGEILKKTNIA